MRSEQQKQYMRRRRQYRECLRRACRVCLATILVGLTIAAALWYDGVELRIPTDAGSGRSSEADCGQAGDSLEYPESLLELLELNPEAEAFVRGYFQNKDKHPEIDLSEEVQQGTIPLFLQWDERWGYETYGSDFLAVTGCGPTCLSMVRCGLSGETDWNPLRTAEFAQREGYYVKGVGTAWDLMTYGAMELGLTTEQVMYDADHILAWLQGGNPIICAMRPGDFTTTGHFIVLSGVDEEGRVIVRDPNSRKNSDKTWGVEELMPQIKNLWGYQYDGGV
ncbi:MAG: C39 family peptidase [bacterium]|nr:C39 family peptidase [bacterium]MCM1375887.1 C39 family peptidase [Muribaculum sp.]